jgi:hypothetical protein
MSSRVAKKLLANLDELKVIFNHGNGKQIEQLLNHLSRQTFTDADSLIRFHETLLFLRAYPRSGRSLRETESLLRQFANRVHQAAEQDEDLTSLDHPEMSGMAGRTVIDTFSYYIVRGLVSRYQRQVSFYWEWFEDENRLGQTWPRFMPILEEDAFVEANIPYREWLRAARGEKAELPWLIERFESLPLEDAAKAELYDSQKLYVRWTPPYRATRTGMRLPAKLAGGRVFYHRQPLLQRRDVSLTDELNKPSPALQRLSKRDGEIILDLARDGSTTRYRELYGFTHGDASQVISAHLGRGVDLFVIGLPPDKRLPLRAYHAAMIFKNHVPVGYFEGLSLFERMESGFNLYYSFREGETGWLYARTLNVMRHLLGVTTFTLDPYQVGFQNEEGIESGAFWFYRKFGFRPTDPDLMKLTEAEEKKIREQKRYRTSARTLRRLAQSPMVFELNKDVTGDWDQFQVRRIGFALQREMATRFGGDVNNMLAEAVRVVKELSKTGGRRLNETELPISDFSTVLLLIKDMDKWSGEDKRDLLSIIQAKDAADDEAQYLRLMQGHRRFRSAIIKLGSRPNKWLKM